MMIDIDQAFRCDLENISIKLPLDADTWFAKNVIWFWWNFVWHQCEQNQIKIMDMGPFYKEISLLGDIWVDLLWALSRTCKALRPTGMQSGPFVHTRPSKYRCFYVKMYQNSTGSYIAGRVRKYGRMTYRNSNGRQPSTKTPYFCILLSSGRVKYGIHKHE